MDLRILPQEILPSRGLRPGTAQGSPQEQIWHGQHFLEFELKITQLLFEIRSSTWLTGCSESSHLGRQRIILKSTDIVELCDTPFFALAICNFLTRFEISRLLIELGSSNIQYTVSITLSGIEDKRSLVRGMLQPVTIITPISGYVSFLLELNAHFGH